MMSEQKSALSVKVEVDMREANENIKELTAAVNECVEAFERLEKKVARFSSPFTQINVKGLINHPDVIKVARNAFDDIKF